MRVKICGIMNVHDALAAAELGADAVGFVLYRSSPRYTDLKTVKNIIAQLPPFVTTVGVFANAEEREILSTVNECGLDLIQLQGDEPADLCRRLGNRVIKAIRVRDKFSLNRMIPYKVRAFVLDTFRDGQLGGTGEIFDWNLAVDAKKFGKIILAGGLTPENIGAAIEQVRPYGVDVSSGVEERVGKKDITKLKRFIEIAKQT
ncbi:MAG TPA: phosphoribosylanthranilate isomerase [Nitrospiria bacterium]|jgi:phosphoribosylanthranilate isomerase|nr:phosphoribosylanthranilate isomerase [Nitrospiria bacterium]